ncbi:SDR family oxidoreductase [Hymenobacter caeli]|uniref:NAD(P)-dependent dehydrogenase (Short-subunit alcohol dehydrogenase family) n=1 Tax=Hymenobacter caeli TaxID=2735894 RepID=A0ABX2FN81_9BACT|nr:SDR family oxidoreductase [Hymenobacter caeli]NRT18303.1 NAD(P)-dependent dehydrogenase (short-subunit alcohol dehydrogenase family) [Hymenobacter caeli]
MSDKPTIFPPQHQDAGAGQPGLEFKMTPEPEFIRPGYKGADKLKGKVALITGGDSGIGRAVAVHFAVEGADVAICYFPTEQEDAEKTQELVRGHGRRCLLLPGDLKQREFCKEIVERTVAEYGQLDVLVNNAAEQNWHDTLEDITDDELDSIFSLNIIAMFRITRAALQHLKEGAAIINTTSVNAYKGNEMLLDYTSTKGAIEAFTRALSLQLIKKGIRVNSVAPGPIWTPFIVGVGLLKLPLFGHDTPMGRAGQPSEVAPAYVFLASEDASYFSGQTLHPNGGSVVNA